MAADYDYLSASSGTGDAILMHITADRAIGATTIVVDSVVNVPAKFIGTTGTLLGTGFIDPTTKRDFKGHVDTGSLIIDAFEPGNTDIGNITGQIVVIKPNTAWANDMVTLAEVSHNADGTIKDDAVSKVSQFADPVDPALRLSEVGRNFVASGGVWSGDAYASTRNASMTAAVVYIDGYRLTVGAVTARAFTASKDTYVDVLRSGTTGTLVYTEATNNAASPALAANSLRLGIIVAGASNIAAATSINQGQQDRVLPIASSIAYSVTDSLGNLIYNTTPSPTQIGYRQILSTPTTISTTSAQVTGLSVPVIVPAGRRVKITFWGGSIGSSTGAGTFDMEIWDGVVNSGTMLAQTRAILNSTQAPGGPVVAYATPSGSKTYNAGFKTASAGQQFNLSAAATVPAFISVELV